MNFCFDEWATSRQRDLKGEKQEYRKHDDDFIDNVRYLYQHRLTYHALRGMLRQVTDQREFEDEMTGNGAMFRRDGIRTGYGMTGRTFNG